MSERKMHRYCGRNFSHEDIERIKSLVRNNPDSSRFKLSIMVCEMLEWRRPDGRTKDMSCRVAMLRMFRDGLIPLPPPRFKVDNVIKKPTLTESSLPGPPVESSAGKLQNLHLEIVRTKKQSSLWNEMIERWHYIGYHPLPGAQIRYSAYCSRGLIALLGFGAAAWKTSPRDNWIGWTREQRRKRLHLIVNNARFLILPWISSKNLASKLLALAAKEIRKDWPAMYGYEPVLLETFVDKSKFRGSSYAAANWTYLGNTKGRGKLDRTHKQVVSIKKVFVYPLVKNFRDLLNAPLSESEN